jgi:polar amino acid transport system substrate-binding protein
MTRRLTALFMFALLATSVCSDALSALTLPTATSAPSTLSTSTPTLPRKKLIVAVTDTPPFVIYNSDSSLSGISVELWRGVAQELKLDYDFRKCNTETAIRWLKEDSIDAALGAITVTPNREEVIDFTQPIALSGTGVAVALGSRNTTLTSILRPRVWRLVALFAGLLVVMLFAGTLIWLLERRNNPEQFSESLSEGIGAGFWWSAVTLATVGYGDKVPKSLAGRALAVVWMFTGIVMISLFTASVTALLTTEQLDTTIQKADDLRRVRVGATVGSSGAEYLDRKHIFFRAYPNLNAAIDGLLQNELDAVVSNAPGLRYAIRQKYDGILGLLSFTLDQTFISVALPQDSPLREPLNRTLLRYMSEDDWRAILFRYLGQE